MILCQPLFLQSGNFVYIHSEKKRFVMETIIISGEKSKVKLLQELARQLGLSEQTLKKPMSEDQALGLLADAVKTGQTVSREDVLNKLKNI